jgi:hypothetical protein
MPVTNGLDSLEHAISASNKARALRTFFALSPPSIKARSAQQVAAMLADSPRHPCLVVAHQTGIC